MTAKEKASDLVFICGKSITNLNMNYQQAKQCALIVVDEIINIGYWTFMESGGKQEQEYWQEVKTEIEKL